MLALLPCPLVFSESWRPPAHRPLGHRLWFAHPSSLPRAPSAGTASLVGRPDTQGAPAAPERQQEGSRRCGSSAGPAGRRRRQSPRIHEDQALDHQLCRLQGPQRGPACACTPKLARPAPAGRARLARADGRAKSAALRAAVSKEAPARQRATHGGALGRCVASSRPGSPPRHRPAGCTVAICGGAGELGGRATDGRGATAGIRPADRGD